MFSVGLNFFWDLFVFTRSTPTFHVLHHFTIAPHSLIAAYFSQFSFYFFLFTPLIYACTPMHFIPYLPPILIKLHPFIPVFFCLEYNKKHLKIIKNREKQKKIFSKIFLCLSDHPHNVTFIFKNIKNYKK